MLRTILVRIHIYINVYIYIHIIYMTEIKVTSIDEVECIKITFHS
jgi:hypothetical protein